MEVEHVPGSKRGSGSAAVDEEGREAKRARTVEPNSEETETEEHEGKLPAEVWARALDFLTYKDVRSCTETCKMFLRDVLPKMEVITVTNYREMNSQHVKRFDVGNIRIVFIGAYHGPLVAEDTIDEDVFEVARSFVPFLSHFQNLKECWLGCFFTDDEYDSYEEDDYLRHYRYSRWREYCGLNPYGFEGELPSVLVEAARIHKELVLTICSAYRAGSLPQNVIFRGIETKCTYWKHGLARGTPCPFCTPINNNFPFWHVFKKRFAIEGCHGTLDDFLKTFSGRVGARAFLKDPKVLVHALCQSNSDLRPLQGAEIALSRIRLLMDLGCDPKEMSVSDLLDGVRAFTQWNPEGTRFYIMQTYYDGLVNLGFPLSEEICIVVPHGNDELFWSKQKKRGRPRSGWSVKLSTGR